MRSNLKILFIICFLLLTFVNFFSVVLCQDIPLRDNTYRLLQRRQEEARELMREGREMLDKGKKKKDQSLITKGTIRMEIGKKQLKALEEEARQKKEEDVNHAF